MVDKQEELKVSEAFEKQWKAIDGDNYPFDKKRLCFIIYESRDAEVKKLRNDCKNLMDINTNQSENIDSWLSRISELQADNKTLREEIEHLKICLNQSTKGR